MLIYITIVLAIIARFIPHMPNVAPITALAIFSAVYLPKKQAITIPLVVRFISDIFLGFFSWPLMVAVYLSHLFGVLIGLWIKSAQEKQKTFWLRITSSGFVSAIVFFLVTNFAFLYASYPHTLSGVIESYVNALPFLRGTMLGDVGYTVALFSFYALGKIVFQKRNSIKQKALQV